MEESQAKLTELQFTIFNGMADDYEDIEQLYLYANRAEAEDEPSNIQSPRTNSQVRFPLRDLVDELANMIREGYIEAKYSNNQQLAPLQPLDFSALHHYWFGATDKGTRAWKGFSPLGGPQLTLNPDTH
jgi:hypothetical protein